MAIIGVNDNGWAIYDHVPQNQTQDMRIHDAQLAQQMFPKGAPSAAGKVSLIHNDSSPISTFVSNNTGNAYGDNGSATNQSIFNTNVGKASAGINSFIGTDPSQLPNPFTSQVTSYQKRLSDLLDNPNSIQNSAAYQWRFNQGLDALNRQLGAKGLLNSGNRIMATEDYGQGAASQEYGDQFKRLSDLYGTNSNAYIGAQNANTNQWQAKGNSLNNYYNNASGAANQATLLDNNNRLGWASIFNNAPPPVYTTSSFNLDAVANPGSAYG